MVYFKILKEGFLQNEKVSLWIDFKEWIFFSWTLNSVLILIYEISALDNTTIHKFHKLRFLVFGCLLETTKKIEMSFLFKAFDVVS